MYFIDLFRCIFSSLFLNIVVWNSFCCCQIFFKFVEFSLIFAIIYCVPEKTFEKMLIKNQFVWLASDYIYNLILAFDFFDTGIQIYL